MAAKPMWECTMTEEAMRASRTGVVVAVTKGVAMRGTRATESARSNVQWYEPWALCGGWVGTGSLTVPSIASVEELSAWERREEKRREVVGTGSCREDFGWHRGTEEQGRCWERSVSK